MIVTPEHAARQAAHHIRNPRYGIHGYRWAGRLAAMLTPEDRSLLDFGCGKGTLADALRRDRAFKAIDIREYDPGIPGKDVAPVAADIVVCTDVLPFVEPALLRDVIARIEELATRALFVAIPYHPPEKLAAASDAYASLPPEEWLAMFARPVESEMIGGGKATPYLLVRWQRP